MWYVQPIGEESAEGELRAYYDQDIKEAGYVKNSTRAWSQRPEVYALWSQTLKSIRSHLRIRAYELITLAASRAIGCVY